MTTRKRLCAIKGLSEAKVEKIKVNSYVYGCIFASIYECFFPFHLGLSGNCNKIGGKTQSESD